MVRAYVTPALENVALWHERDISHSSVERMIGPDATATLDFALVRLAGVIDKLVVYPEQMRKNLDRSGGLVHSQRVMLALTQKGAAREDAYRLVQRHAMKAWKGERRFPVVVEVRRGSHSPADERRDRCLFRSRPSPPAGRYDLRPRVRSDLAARLHRQGGGRCRRGRCADMRRWCERMHDRRLRCNRTRNRRRR